MRPPCIRQNSSYMPVRCSLVFPRVPEPDDNCIRRPRCPHFLYTTRAMNLTACKRRLAGSLCPYLEERRGEGHLLKVKLASGRCQWEGGGAGGHGIIHTINIPSYILTRCRACKPTAVRTTDRHRLLTRRGKLSWRCTSFVYRIPLARWASPTSSRSNLDLPASRQTITFTSARYHLPPYLATSRY
jgi:hypothetical protein